MLNAVLVTAGLYILLMVINFAYDYWKVMCNRKCPHCGHRMKYLYTRYDDKDNPVEYGFHCSKCGHVEAVSADRLMNENFV